jgi:poly(3-hydroxyalkanoate) synthetase
MPGDRAMLIQRMAPCERTTIFVPMGRIAGPQLPSAAFLWPALAAVSASEFATAIAKSFVSLAAAEDAGPKPQEPGWPTRNKVVLALRSVRLRDFSTTCEGPAALVCAPFALHGASVVDFAPGHSLVAALLAAGMGPVFVTDWRSADVEMRFFSIDTYLADLNVLVDQLGGTIDLIGLCQGGWMALMYAVRFPHKVRKLVLAGAPIDIAAGESPLSRIAEATPLSVFKELVDVGGGRMLGSQALRLWGPGLLDARSIGQVLQTSEAIGSGRLRRFEARFRDWYAWTVDLPGTYYLEVVERLFKQNQLARGQFVALGRRLDLRDLHIPVFLLAAGDDELVAPAQVFATERLVGTPSGQLRKAVAASTHLGLFMGSAVLAETWPAIVRWLAEPPKQRQAAPHHPQVHALRRAPARGWTPN